MDIRLSWKSDIFYTVVVNIIIRRRSVDNGWKNSHRRNAAKIL